MAVHGGFLSALWKRAWLFTFGATLCVLLYLFLLNFPPVGIQSRTAGLVPVVALAASTSWLTARFLHSDGLSAAVLGLTRRGRPIARFGIGVLAGSVLTLSWFGIVTTLMGATWHRNAAFNFPALCLGAAFYFFNNVGEELVYRGYLFVRLADTWGASRTMLATSGVFAVLHLQAGLPLLSVIATVFTSGLIFAAIFVRWRSLPLALGVHVATNVVQDLTGLRPGAASLLSAQYPAQATDSGRTVLAMIAALNAAVAVGIVALRRRRTA